MRRFCLILVWFAGFRLLAGEVMPPSPTAYFNDYAHLVSVGTAAQLNQSLENFERQSSEQIVVAVFPKMESDSSIEDYTVRVARSWQVGLKDKNNGAVLFVFVQDHTLFFQVGYGLEGILPDALCQRLIDEQITPRFKAGDFDGGLTAGVQSVIAAAKGEYQGTGRTVADEQDSRSPDHQLMPMILFMGVFLIFVLARVFIPGSRGRRGWVYTGGGWGGGGFSGGGGSFGGGGAGGHW